MEVDGPEGEDVSMEVDAVNGEDDAEEDPWDPDRPETMSTNDAT
jgi:hypothetical protein